MVSSLGDVKAQSYNRHRFQALIHTCAKLTVQLAQKIGQTTVNGVFSSMNDNAPPRTERYRKYNPFLRE